MTLSVESNKQPNHTLFSLSCFHPQSTTTHIRQLELKETNQFDISVLQFANHNVVSHQQKRVTFVSYPYKALPSGEAAQCRWMMGSSSAALDPIQNAAYTDGICLPVNSSLHVFSMVEAIECLISVIISGDIYTRQLFIGLADILLRRPPNNEIRNQTFRLELIERSNAELAARHVNDTSFPDVQYPMECFWGCYGSGSSRYRFSILFSMCIRLYFIKVLLRKLLESAIVAKHNV